MDLTVFVGPAAAVLGENLEIPPWLTESAKSFWGINFVTLCISVCVFYVILGYIRYKLR